VAQTLHLLSSASGDGSSPPAIVGAVSRKPVDHALPRMRFPHATHGPLLDPIQVTASSVDLRLGNRFIRLDRRIALQRGIGADIRFDVGSANWEQLVEAYGETAEVPDGEPFELDRSRLVLGWTKEYIRLPETLAGRVEGKSKPAHLGLLVHVTAPTLQVGWEGNLQLEFFQCRPCCSLA